MAEPQASNLMMGVRFPSPALQTWMSFEPSGSAKQWDEEDGEEIVFERDWPIET